MNQPILQTSPPAHFPATPTQRHLWTAHQRGAAQNLLLRLQIDGRFSDDSVARALQQLIGRHEILRTALAETGGVLQQCVSPEVGFHLPSIDLRGLAAADGAARIDGIARGLGSEIFTLDSPGQIRACLVRSDAARAVLLVAAHGAVFDAGSVPVLMRDIARLIACAETGDAAHLPALALQFGDYALWRADCDNSGASAAAGDFWAQQVAGFAPLLVPRDSAAPGATADPVPMITPLGQDFADRLTTAARRSGVTRFAFASAVFAAALSGLTGRRDVAFATGVDGRDEAALDHLIGNFANRVLLRHRDAGGDIARSAGRAQQILAAALDHGDYPFPLLPGQPLTDFSFDLGDDAPPDQSAGGITLRHLGIETPGPCTGIAVAVVAADQGWALRAVCPPTGPAQALARDLSDRLAQSFDSALSRFAGRGAVTARPPAQPPVPDATLHRLKGIWAQILGHEIAGPEADFFDNGGHSMRALQMLTRIEHEFGVPIEIAAFLADPTLAGLAGKIQAATGQRGAAPAREWAATTLANPDGAAALVVALNQPFLYLGLGSALTPSAELVSLQLGAAADTDTLGQARLDQLSTTAATQITALARGRPVTLIGHCVDGVLALAVAGCLDRQGATPAQLYMIDSWRPGAEPGGPAVRLRQRARRWGVNLGQLARRGMGAVEFLAGFRPTRALLTRWGALAPPTGIERRELAVNAYLDRLVPGADFPPYRGAATLFATAGAGDSAQTRLFGWSGTLAPDTPVFPLPGWHEHAVRSGGAARIADIVNCRLDRPRKEN